MPIYKKIILDDEKYNIEFAHAPKAFSPYGFQLTIRFNGRIVKDKYYDNMNAISFKEAIMNIVKEIHTEIKNKQARKSAISMFENELIHWDGVIE